MAETKTALRRARWAALIASGDARFPGTIGRIPNFVGAEAAARNLFGTAAWEQAAVIKVNPDSPQRPVRHAALKAGKRIYLPAPKLADACPFILLDPAVIHPKSLWPASSIKGAYQLGQPVPLEAVPPLDLIVTGCVGVTRAGARLGKGGGYSDLEFAMLRDQGCVGPDTVIATTVHAVQILEDGMIPVEAHDISLDLIATPAGVIETGRGIPRPSGVLWERLPEEKRAAIPALQALWEARGAVSSAER